MSESNHDPMAEFRIFLTILLVVFVTLKLTDVGFIATWSWWLVLSPFWVPVAFAGLAFFLWGLVLAWKKLRDRNHE